MDNMDTVNDKKIEDKAIHEVWLEASFSLIQQINESMANIGPQNYTKVTEYQDSALHFVDSLLEEVKSFNLNKYKIDTNKESEFIEAIKALEDTRKALIASKGVEPTEHNSEEVYEERKKKEKD